MRRRGLDGPGRETAARLYEQGMTLEEVAAELSVGDETVRSAVVACGGTIRPRGRRSSVELPLEEFLGSAPIDVPLQRHQSSYGDCYR